MTIPAFAKVNLTLEVYGKRSDGFHALRSVLLPIEFSDTLVLEPAEDFSTDTGYPDDLILKAAKALAGLQAPGVGRQPYAIRVTKRIPAGGGLGGGSSDAAATLLALNELWGLGMTPEQLADVGAQVGSDVPALVLANHYRAPVLMEGRGEIVSLLNPADSESAHRPHFRMVVVDPGVPSSTARVYGECQARVTDAPDILYTMRQALETDDIGRICGAMVNDLQKTAVGLYPAIGEAMLRLREAGALGVTMSGSGSSVFGLVPTEDEGRKTVALLNDQGIRARSVTACPVV